MPSLVSVAANATMSGIGVADAENNRVFKPELIGAGSLLVQSKLRWMSVGENDPVGVKPTT